MKKSSAFYPSLFLIGCATVWTTLVQHDPFFWDTVQLGSKHAHFFFENNLHWKVLPKEIDSGHPPVFGYYLAVAWTLLGKTLPVSHWAMFPFLAGIALLLHRLGRYFISETSLFTAAKSPPQLWPYALVLLAFLDPVLAGQSALIGPDIPLACFFLLSVWAFLIERRTWAMLGILGLCAISTRGMMTAAALFAWQILAHWPGGNFRLSVLIRTGLTFLPGVAFAAWFLWWHQQAAGWTGFHTGSPWAQAFELVHGADLLKNILVLGWRWTDFGRLVEWAVLAYLIWVFVSSAAAAPKSGVFAFIKNLPTRFLAATAAKKNGAIALLLLGCLVLFLSPSALLYRNLSAHRYFLPAFLALHLFVFCLLVVAQIPQKRKNLLLLVLLIGLGTGNGWIYPRGISMDWDATLAHRPYHRLRAEMLIFIKKEKIPLQDIGTAFPNVNTGEHLLLNGDQRCFAEKNFLQNQYMLTSNVFNDFSEQNYSVLEREWILVKRLEHCGVWMRLFQKP